MSLFKSTSTLTTVGNAFAKRGLAAILVLALVLAGCATDPFTGEEKASNKAKGAGIGAVGGAIVGQIVGGNRKGTLLGLGIGALVGTAVGHYMDKEEEKLRQELRDTGVSVTRVGDSLVLNMPGNITFATNSSNINANFYPVLDSVAKVVNEFEQTYIDITGHTDSTGSMDINQPLSEARANSVALYLKSQQVLPERIVTQGVGPRQPIATNETPEGRALNRRVELRLTPIT